MTDSPRNLLIIVTDQMRGDLFTGAFSGFGVTPNLDRLAAQSICFLDHHTNTVPCAPARASLLTGCYAMTNGVSDNGIPLARHFPTLATELRTLGREPLLFGYTDTQADPTGLHPSDPALHSYTAPAPGFTEVQEMREEGWAWLAHLRARGYDVPDVGADDFNRLYRPQDGIAGNPALYDAADSDTAFLTDRTLADLDIRKSRPWSALVTYIRPHPPYVAPAPYHDRVAAADTPDAAQGFDHAFFDAFHSGAAALGLFWGFDGRQNALTKDDTARCRAAYLGLIAELDHHIGRLLDWLDDTGQADDTLLVFTSDHGDMLGDRGIWGKRTPFRQASHIPLMIRDPRHAAGRANTVTEAIDVVPTLLRRLGGTPPRAMDGGDLDRVSERKAPVAMVEMELGTRDGSGRFEQFTGLSRQSCRAVALQTQKWRYVHFAGGFDPMLFDTVSDPMCTTDLAGSEPDRAAQLQRQLLEHRMRYAYP